MGSGATASQVLYVRKLIHLMRSIPNMSNPKIAYSHLMGVLGNNFKLIDIAYNIRFKFYNEIWQHVIPAFISLSAIFENDFATLSSVTDQFKKVIAKSPSLTHKQKMNEFAMLFLIELIKS